MNEKSKSEEPKSILLSSSVIGAIIGAITGAIFGALLTYIITTKIYERQLHVNQYLAFVDELDKTIYYSGLSGSEELDKKAKADLEFSLNKAWAKAFVVLPDDVFLEIDKLFSRKSMNKATRNRIYHTLRKHLNPKTAITYDDYMDKFITVTEGKRIKGNAGN